jgi:hypothetical protein
MRASSSAGAEDAAEAKHREGGAQPKLTEAVFGFAPGARVVAHAEFTEAKTGGNDNGGEKRLQQFEGEEAGNDFAAHRAKLAAAVVEVVAEDAAADKIGEARHAAAEP